MSGWPRFYTLTKRKFEYSALGTDRLAVEGQSSPHLPAAVKARGVSASEGTFRFLFSGSAVQPGRACRQTVDSYNMAKIQAKL